MDEQCAKFTGGPDAARMRAVMYFACDASRNELHGRTPVRCGGFSDGWTRHKQAREALHFSSVSDGLVDSIRGELVEP